MAIPTGMSLTPSAENKAEQRVNLRAELDALEGELNELKIQFELYFTGIHPLPPDKLHDQVKRHIRTLTKAPFKSSEIHFRFKTLKNRYSSFNTYFQRVQREREEGTYVRDVFKAEVRERAVDEQQQAQTPQGAASNSMKDLFKSYREALEKATGKTHELDFEKFRNSLAQRAKELRERIGTQKLVFKVVVKNGKVVVKAQQRLG